MVQYVPWAIFGKVLSTIPRRDTFIYDDGNTSLQSEVMFTLLVLKIMSSLKGTDLETKKASSKNGSDVQQLKIKKTYLPDQPLEDGESLVCDFSAYIMLHEYRTDAPCLSFDIIADDLGNNRDTFPQSCNLVAGTQASNRNANSLIVMRISYLHRTQESNKEDDTESSEESDDEADESKITKLHFSILKHQGCINRVRSTIHNQRQMAAVWSELGRVSIVDLTSHLECVNNPHRMVGKTKGKEPFTPLYVFEGHQTEGYALDWSPTRPGWLVTGDCQSNIHVWKPDESSWHVDQRPLVGHKDSVEDLQWSPTDNAVLASCSVDRSIRIWDTRASPLNACKLTVPQAHESDVNVISWNKLEPLILSGGDDGLLHVWDLRNFKAGSAVASLKHHTSAVTTVEWSPNESSVFASGGDDNQIALWDLAVERDPAIASDADIQELPPQLLFIHQGQTDIKELHWHRQIPGTVISTANSGFNIFRTISI